MARPELATEPRQEYVDDGYSGTSTSRPAFQRLIQDAQDGKVKTIIVKDFSRFARDYIEAGDYMERIFPLLGVPDRFSQSHHSGGSHLLLSG